MTFLQTSKIIYDFWTISVTSLGCESIFSCDYTKTIWVYFANGNIEAGWGSDVRHNKIIEYIDYEDPLEVKSVAFATGDNIEGEWHLISLRGKICLEHDDVTNKSSIVNLQLNDGKYNNWIKVWKNYRPTRQVLTQDSKFQDEN